VVTWREASLQDAHNFELPGTTGTCDLQPIFDHIALSDTAPQNPPQREGQVHYTQNPMYQCTTCRERTIGCTVSPA
jgi:hypothetical protein